MFNFSLEYVGLFKKPEKFVQIISSPWILFYVSGLKYMKEYLPDGRLIRTSGSDEKPYFDIKPPGTKVDFEFGKGRENWVLTMENISVRPSSDGKFSEIKEGSKWIRMPFKVEVTAERVEGWQMELRRIKESWSNPTPLNSLRAKLGVANILRFMLDRQPDNLGFSPEEKLKRLIDEDTTFSKSIQELSDECGMSKDHLRILFQNRYQVNPIIYRNQKRGTDILELIANSSLSLKEIASRLGFKHVSHFCIEHKKRYGITPLEGIRKFRNSRS